MDRAHMDGLSGAMIRVSCSAVGTATVYTVMAIQVLRTENRCVVNFIATCVRR